MKNNIIKKTKDILNKKNIIIMIISILLLVSLFIIRSKNKETDDLYTVRIGTVSDELVFAGVVDAEKRADLGFSIGGRVIKNNVEEGDFVKKGQILAEIDQSTVKANLIQANANYELTKIDTLINTKNTSSSYEEILKEQNTIVDNLYKQYISGDLQAYYVGDDGVVKNVSAPVISGNYNSNEDGSYYIDVYNSSSASGYSYLYSGLESGHNSVEVKQPVKLGSNGLYIKFSDNEDYSNTKWEIPVPNIRSSSYLSRKTAYENALVQRDKILSDAKNNLDKFVKNDNPSGMSYGDALINNAKAQINASYVRLSDGKIIAPFDGYIVKNNLEIGETAQALIPQIIMFSNKKKKLILNTPEIYINKINVGDKVDIILDSSPDDIFSGHIVKIDDIDTIVDGVPVYETEVLFDDENDNIRVGMNAHANITVFKKDNVLVVPKHFIKKDNENEIVFIKDNNEIRKQRINTGLEGNNGLVEVISGLSVGQLVVFKSE